MRAIQVTRFGPPDVLRLTELPDPSPGPEQVLVAAEASDVLFVDTMIRSGGAAAYFPVTPPYVPGNGVGGRVAAVGPDVDPGWLNQRVAAHTGGQGGYAELAVADLEHTVAVPDDVDLHQATAVLHDGTTALRLLETTNPRKGDWVLVVGAAGGMGILLVQLLTALGAKVIGTARGEAKLNAITKAGAQVVVDYSQENWTDAVLDATGGTEPKIVLDGVGGPIGSAAFGLVQDGGRFSAHGAPSGSMAVIDENQAKNRRIQASTIRDLQYGPHDRSRLMKEVLAQLTDKKISPLIGQTFSLADASEAHEAIAERRAVAKTLLLTGRQ